MSGLEDAAAAQARRNREVADTAATQHAAGQEAHRTQREYLRARSREFFTFARDHGATIFPLYLSRGNGSFTRTSEVCVMATRWSGIVFGSSTFHRWAVTKDGKSYYGTEVRERKKISKAWRLGIRDEFFIAVPRHAESDWSGWENGASTYYYGVVGEPELIAAASALIDSVPVFPKCGDPRTGVQSNGAIGYLQQ